MTSAINRQPYSARVTSRPSSRVSSAGSSRATIKKNGKKTAEVASVAMPVILATVRNSKIQTDRSKIQNEKKFDSQPPNSSKIDNSQHPQASKIDMRELEHSVLASENASMAAQLIVVSRLQKKSKESSPRTPPIQQESKGGRLTHETNTAALFSRIINSAFFEQIVEEMPKVELHNHVCGSIDPITFLQAAVKKGLYIDVNQRKFFVNGGEGRILVKEFMELKGHEEARNAFISKMTADIQSHHTNSHEGDPFSFFNSFAPGDSLTDMDDSDQELMPWGEQFEIPLKEAQRQRVFYTEFMKGVWTRPIPEMEPYFKSSGENLNHDFTQIIKLGKETGYMTPLDAELVTEALSSPYNAPFKHLKDTGVFDRYIDLFTRKVNEADQYLAKSAELPLGVPEFRLIAQVYRERVNPELFTNLAVAMSLSNQVPRFRGITIAGQEDSVTSINNVKGLYGMMTYLYHRYNDMRPGVVFNKDLAKVKVTVHAGEYKPKEITNKTVPSKMSDNVLLAAQIFDRIGHGTVMSKEAMEVIQKRNIGVELCPSSSKNILGIPLNKHPVREWLTKGIDISVNTDDAAVNNTTLTGEWISFIEVFKPTWDLVKNMIRGTIEQSFLNGESIFTKSGKSYILKPEFESILDLEIPTDEEIWAPKNLQSLIECALKDLSTDIGNRIKASEKARLQLGLVMHLFKYEYTIHKAPTLKEPTLT